VLALSFQRLTATICFGSGSAFVRPYAIMSAVAPAGGAAAAAPEEGALAGPSASPHLPVEGAGNPIAVLGLAR
jgi:hypothetical protein